MTNIDYPHPFCNILAKHGYKRWPNKDIYQPYDWHKRIIETDDNSNWFGCLMVKEWHFPDHFSFSIDGDLNNDGLLRRMTWQDGDWNESKLLFVEQEYRELVNYLEEKR